MPKLYPKMVKVPPAWGLGFRMINGRRRSRLLMAGFWPYVRSGARELIAQNPSDIIVSVHPFATTSGLRAMKIYGEKRPPFVTVVTDLVSTHALWYNRKTDLCLVPTEIARSRALKYGLAPDQVRVVGLPVADRFCQPIGDKRSLREQLGWPQDLPITLLVGGGEGMGPLDKTAMAIAQAKLPLALIIVTGRNRKLKNRLEAHTWRMPVLIYGFVNQMPEFMRAADILVTKAGPGTICEALNAGLPMILYSRLPGQEEGNVSFVVSEGAGLWAPDTIQIVQSLRLWLENPQQRHDAAIACQRLAYPSAARQIARILGEKLAITVN